MCTKQLLPVRRRFHEAAKVRLITSERQSRRDGRAVIERRAVCLSEQNPLRVPMLPSRRQQRRRRDFLIKGLARRMLAGRLHERMLACTMRCW